jgi:hypothetical protein
MSLNPTQFVSAGLFIIAGAYGTYLYNQHLSQPKLETEKPNSTILKVISEESEQLPWEGLKENMKDMKCMSRRPASMEWKMACEEFVKEEMASEAAFHAWVRSCHQQR